MPSSEQSNPVKDDSGGDAWGAFDSAFDKPQEPSKQEDDGFGAFDQVVQATDKAPEQTDADNDSVFGDFDAFESADKPSETAP